MRPNAARGAKRRTCATCAATRNTPAPRGRATPARCTRQSKGGHHRNKSLRTYCTADIVPRKRRVACLAAACGAMMCGCRPRDCTTRQANRWSAHKTRNGARHSPRRHAAIVCAHSQRWTSLAKTGGAPRCRRGHEQRRGAGGTRGGARPLATRRARVTPAQRMQQGGGGRRHNMPPRVDGTAHVAPQGRNVVRLVALRGAVTCRRRPLGRANPKRAIAFREYAR